MKKERITARVLAAKRPGLLMDADSMIGHSPFMDPECHSGAAGVAENGELVGILTERDILKRVLACGLVPAETRVRDVMTSSPVTVPANAYLQEVLDAVTKSGYRYMPVMDGDIFVGMIDVRDLYAAVQVLMQESMDSLETVFHSMMSEPYGGGPAQEKKDHSRF